MSRRSAHFYPRSHVGNDHYVLRKISRRSKFLSTFPRRERQVSGKAYPADQIHFYPRSHVGNDGLPNGARMGFSIFLSTFPRRERQATKTRSSYSADFYPRSHVGNDVDPVAVHVIVLVFLSTFPRRERPSLLFPATLFCSISIHVPT